MYRQAGRIRSNCCDERGAEVSEDDDKVGDREEIAATERLIRPHIRQTPVVQVDGSDFGLASLRLSLKLELLQHGGSFKARRAFANLLMRDVPEVGVAAASGGNHWLAVAYDSRVLGIYRQR